MKRVGFIAGFLVFLSAGQARAVVLGPELLVNGSFEDPDILAGTFFIDTSIAGWTSTLGSGIEIQDHVAGSPFDGNQHVELDSFTSSNMFQDVVTQAGQLYHVQLAYSPRPGVNLNGIQALWNGLPLVTLAGNGVGLSDTVWQLFQFNVFATSSSTRLEFRDTGPSNSLGGYLDAVSVRQVGGDIPEPGTILVLGLGALFLASRRRRS